jgi:hypothetical protein
MAQFARPDSDISSSIRWSGSYTLIDEVTPDDGDYLTCSNSANATCEKGLSDLADPISDADHTVRFRAWQSNNTNIRGLTVTLVQGSTTIAAYSTGDLPKGTPTAFEFTLTSGQADSITDYTDIRLRFTSTGNTAFGDRSYVYVSWAELEVPTPVDSAPRVTQHSVEVGYTLPEDILVAHHIVEVAWQPLPVFYVPARVIEVAYLRSGRIYGVAVGHF